MKAPAPALVACLAIALMSSSFTHSTAQTPNNIEACEYDPGANRWFVSNGNSLLETSDQGASWGYFGSADATHGMEVLGDVLYAIDAGTLRAYSLSTAEELGSLGLGLSFANGMGNDGLNTLIISDFSSGKIIAVDVSDPAAMSKSTLVNDIGATPNGVVVDVEGGRAVVVCWGGNADVLAVDLVSGEVSTLVDGTGLGNLDGIDVDGSGRYYVSSWSPARITRYSADFTDAETVADGTDGLSSPADISYAIELDTLGVANSGNSQVTFHGFGTDGLETLNHTEPRVWHNAEGFTAHLGDAGRVLLLAYALDGRLLGHTSLDLPAGRTRVCWDRLGREFVAASIIRVAQADGGWSSSLRK